MTATFTVQGQFTDAEESESTPLFRPTTLLVFFEGSVTGQVDVEINYGDGWKIIHSITETTATRINATSEGHLYRLNCSSFTDPDTDGDGDAETGGTQISYRLN